MKNTIIKSFLTLLSVLLCNTAILAQVTVINDNEPPQFEALDFSTFTINGLEMAGPEYTEQDIIRAFGQPDSVELGEFGYTYIMLKEAPSIPKNYIPTGGIYAAEIILHTKPKGAIYVVGIFDEKYTVNNFINVGDSMSKIYEMDGDFKEVHYKEGDSSIYWRPTEWENIEFFNCPQFMIDKNGTIIGISLWSY